MILRTTCRVLTKQLSLACIYMKASDVVRKGELEKDYNQIRVRNISEIAYSYIAFT